MNKKVQQVFYRNLLLIINLSLFTGLFCFIVFSGILNYLFPIIGLIISFGLLFILALLLNKVIKIFFETEVYDGEYVNKFKEIAHNHGIKIKEFRVRNSELINAAAVVIPKNFQIIFTSKLLEKCSAKEIEAVFFHELGHLKDYKFILNIYRIVIFMLFVVSFLNYFILKQHSVLFVGVAALESLFIQLLFLKLMRVGEYKADKFAKELMHNPIVFSVFFEKVIAEYELVLDKKVDRKLGLVKKLFSTHPEFNERIKQFQL